MRRSSQYFGQEIEITERFIHYTVEIPTGIHFEPQLTYQISRYWSKYTVIGSFWKVFDVKLTIKQVKSGFERHRLQKTGLKVAF